MSHPSAYRAKRPYKMCVQSIPLKTCLYYRSGFNYNSLKRRISLNVSEGRTALPELQSRSHITLTKFVNSQVCHFGGDTIREGLDSVEEYPP